MVSDLTSTDLRKQSICVLILLWSGYGLWLEEMKRENEIAEAS